MPQYAATIRHLSEGVKGFTINAAVKNIEGWEATLEKVEAPGAKGIVRDLQRLKKLISEERIDGDAVRKLMAKLGDETVKIASKAEGANAEKVKDLGEALNKSAA
jgi:hypothetical protein